MKRSTKKKISIICAILSVVGILGGISILYALGFRVTYAPELENSWDAISAVASWAGVIVAVVGVFVSGLAIYYAVQVPQKIADRQDKIELFTKRIECYTCIQNLIACADQISSVSTNKEIQTAFRIWLNPENSLTKNMQFSDFAVQLNSMKPILVSGSFLFEKYDANLLQDIIHTGISLLNQVTSHPKQSISEEALQSRAAFCNLCDCFYRKYITSMESELNLNCN